MTGVDKADGRKLFANTPTQVEFSLFSLKQTSRGIGIYVNANKTEFIF